MKTLAGILGLAIGAAGAMGQNIGPELPPEMLEEKVEQRLTTADLQLARENPGMRAAYLNNLYLETQPENCSGFLYDSDGSLAAAESRKLQNMGSRGSARKPEHRIAYVIAPPDMIGKVESAPIMFSPLFFDYKVPRGTWKMLRDAEARCVVRHEGTHVQDLTQGMWVGPYRIDHKTFSRSRALPLEFISMLKESRAYYEELRCIESSDVSDQYRDTTLDAAKEHFAGLYGFTRQPQRDGRITIYAKKQLELLQGVVITEHPGNQVSIQVTFLE